MPAPRILISAGEPSGDLHGAAVARALRQRWPGAELYGLGGPRMEAEGVRLLAHVDELAVMGFVEVASRLPYFIRLLRRMRRSLDERPPSLVVPIDYPGFNLRLAAAARKRGIPVLYYIAPQVWAWHRSRVHGMAGRTDAIAVILPFEEPLFREAGGRATFVGHPLLDRERPVTPRATFLGELGVDPARPVLALFPGSREQEVRRHAGLFAAAARRVVERHPEVQPVVGAGPGVPPALLAGMDLPSSDDGWALLHHARAALVKSGTGTLEAALAGTPLVIAYRMHPATYAVARRLVEVEHVGLVNLVAGERVAPELIQDAATPESLAEALGPLLVDGPARERALRGISRVRSALQVDGPEPSVAARVAALAARLIPNAA